MKTALFPIIVFSDHLSTATAIHDVFSKGEMKSWWIYIYVIKTRNYFSLFDLYIYTHTLCVISTGWNCLYGKFGTNIILYIYIYICKYVFFFFYSCFLVAFNYNMYVCARANDQVKYIVIKIIQDTQSDLATRRGNYSVTELFSTCDFWKNWHSHIFKIIDRETYQLLIACSLV